MSRNSWVIGQLNYLLCMYEVIQGSHAPLLARVKLNEFKEDRNLLSEKTASETGAELEGLTGNGATFYKPHPKPKNRHYTMLEPIASQRA